MMEYIIAYYFMISLFIQDPNHYNSQGFHHWGKDVIQPQLCLQILGIYKQGNVAKIPVAPLGYQC